MAPAHRVNAQQLQRIEGNVCSYNLGELLPASHFPIQRFDSCDLRFYFMLLLLLVLLLLLLLLMLPLLLLVVKAD